MLTNFKKSFTKVRARTAAFMKRRPHRSFRLTRRRDYQRSLKLPGLWAFTRQVNRTLWGYRRVFLWLLFFYALASSILVGIASQDSYTTLSSTLRDTGTQVFQGDWNQLGQAGFLFVAIIGNGISGTPTEGQQIYGVLLVLLVWLTTIWLLRNLLAGHKVRMRDGLYSAGSPIVSTLLVGLVFFVQLLPIGLALLGYYAALASGLLNNGVEAMLFWAASAALAALSLYWLTSTFIALIIVTLPGMYPIKALRTAGDIVVSRRLRILLRILWMLLNVVASWAIVMIPFILLDTWLKGLWPQIQWLPIIPVLILLLTTLSVVWMASYIYLLYRKIVDDDAKPAL